MPLPPIELPDKLQFLLEPCRYKVPWGGRGGAKSWSVARALLGMSVIEKRTILCAREIQKSIKQSVHQLMCNQIEALNMGAYWEVLDTEIRGIVSGTNVQYAGLQGHTSQSIKSYEGVDICWVEEGQTVPMVSWNILTPTIRRPGSEIWVTMNPIIKSDPAWQLFVETPDPNCRAVHVTYRDNPYFTAELEAERLKAFRTMDKETYDNVWEGLPRGAVTGAIYGAMLQQMRSSGRIGMVVPRQRLAVNAFMDLGTSVGNATSIWMHQHYGNQHLFIKHWAETGKGLSYWWNKMDYWRLSKNLRWGKIYMPHDGKADLQGAEVQNRVEILEEIIAQSEVPGGAPEVETVPRVQDLSAAIELTREKLADAFIDETECADGIKALENYRYKWDEDRQVFSRQPEHTWASNSADAIRQWATGYDFSMPGARPPSEAGAGGYINGGY